MLMYQKKSLNTCSDCKEGLQFSHTISETEYFLCPFRISPETTNLSTSIILRFVSGRFRMCGSQSGHGANAYHFWSKSNPPKWILISFLGLYPGIFDRTDCEAGTASVHTTSEAKLGIERNEMGQVARSNELISRYSGRSPVPCGTRWTPDGGCSCGRGYDAVWSYFAASGRYTHSRVTYCLRSERDAVVW